MINDDIKEKIQRLRAKNERRMRLIQQIRQELQYKKQQSDIEYAESVFNKSPQYEGQKF